MGKIVKPVIDFEGLPEGPAWYTVITRYNYENACALDIYEGLKGKRLEDEILECVVPIRESMEIKENRKGEQIEKLVQEKIYPNYVFVSAIMNERVWDYIRTRKGVATILAPGGAPLVMDNFEMDKIKSMCTKINKEE